MEQVKNRRYDEALREEGRCHILVYGIAFCKKRCKVVLQKIWGKEKKWKRELSANKRFRLQNEEGKYLEYDGNNYTGDMKVHSCEQSDWESKTDL